MQLLRDEMIDFYEPRRTGIVAGEHDPIAPIREAIWSEMDSYLAAHPAEGACLLKAALQEEIAERFEPKIFPHSPFFYEMGLQVSENWGIATPFSPNYWLWNKRLGAQRDLRGFRQVRHMGFHPSPIGLANWEAESGFDYDHHCLGYTKLLKVGVSGIIAELDGRLADDTLTEDQRDFLTAAIRSNCAMIHVAERFAEKAEQMLAEAGDADEQSAKFLRMIASAAAHVPANPPRTFYEGLASIWFLREVTGTLEGIGVSVVGHMDRLLIDLYRADIQAGRLTELDARDLLARWMMPTDIRFHTWDNHWPETSTCIELGGCDADGNAVFNELTRLFVEVHAEQKLLNPKLNCRYSAGSSQEYLELLSEHILAGHNVFALLNDDVLIPACVKAGKTRAEARLYANGGCQETVVEGVEHSAGAYYYFNMPRVLDMCLQPAPQVPEEVYDEQTDAAMPRVINRADTFKEFYSQVIAALKLAIAAGADCRRTLGVNWRNINPCPFFSTSLEGCIASATDYSAGGAKYNPAGVALVGFATLTDSLFAVKQAVFDEKWLSLDELKTALAANWSGHESLRQRMIGLHKFGQGHDDVDSLAARIAAELGEFAGTIENERGGRFQASLFVYYAFVRMAHRVRATPDGRADFEMLSQGCAPGRQAAGGALTDVLRSQSRIDWTDYPGNAVLDLQLPVTAGISPSTLAAVIRSFAQMGGATLQPNAVSVADLTDAKTNPDAHRDLVVRISGLSAQFVALMEDVQDEIIDRYCVQI